MKGFRVFLSSGFAKEACFGKADGDIRAALYKSHPSLQLSHFDISGLSQMLVAGDKYIEKTDQEWADDSQSLLQVVEVCMLKGWAILLDNILDESDQHKTLKEIMVNNQQNMNRSLNGCRMLNSWLKIFKAMNNDGCALLFIVELLLSMEKVATSGSHYGEVAYMLRMLEVDLPTIKNNMARKRAAADLINKHKNNEWGKAINAALLEVAQGKEGTPTLLATADAELAETMY